jgi:hypothetical protein
LNKENTCSEHHFQQEEEEEEEEVTLQIETQRSENK